MRNSKIFIIIGRRESGKTTIALKYFRKRNTLFVNTLRDKRYKNCITPSEVTDTKVSRYEAVIFDDATAYIMGSLTDDLVRFLVNSKQWQTDVCLCFHSINLVPPKVLRLADFCIIMASEPPNMSRLKSIIGNELAEELKNTILKISKLKKFSRKIISF
jgi:hypothetical protein